MFCLQVLHMPLRDVFWVAAVPGALSVVVVLLAVREAPRSPAQAPTPAAESVTGADVASAESPVPVLIVPPAPLGAGFRGAMVAILVFTLGNSTDAFLLLRATQLGVPVVSVPLLWLVLHVVKMASSPPGGALSDRFGRRPLIVAGWLLYAAVYAGFALARTPAHVWMLFAAYGVVFGLTEGSEKALVADLVPAERRGAAFGWYHAAVGIAALPASVLFGVLWDKLGASIAFGAGSGIALIAVVLFALAVPAPVRPPPSTP